MGKTNQYRNTDYRIKVENELGRKLKKGEYIHHINGDKTDNRIENLKVVNNIEHSRIHALDSLKPNLHKRIPIQFQNDEELLELRKELINIYPGEKPRYIYTKAFIRGMKELIKDRKKMSDKNEVTK